MKRRTFLKIAGIGSISIAAGCSPPEKTLYSLVRAPDDMVTGNPTWYATTCRECPAGCGVLAGNREGRIVKLEGNPLHPINRGRLCMRGQAALQEVYHPDRIRQPLINENGRWQPISAEQALALIREKTSSAAAQGKNRVRMLTEVTGDSLLSLFTEALAQWKSAPPLVFEPYGYESLKMANREVFGLDGLPAYRMDQADLLVSFGADFLETWLSPVEYAWKFKAMHAGGNGFFAHVAPYQSLTGANADLWLSCRPGGETAVALGLMRETLDAGRGSHLPEPIGTALRQASSIYDRGRVLDRAGVDPGDYDRLVARVLGAKKPLVLGTGAGGSGPNGLQTDMAACALNLALDPELSLIDNASRHRVEIAASRADIRKGIDELKSGPAGVLILHNVNPVFSLPPDLAADTALKRKELFVISFSNFMDETSALADLIVPYRLPLESWDEYAGKQGTVSTLQPTVGKITDAPMVGDILLKAAFGGAPPAPDYKTYVVEALTASKVITDPVAWVEVIRCGGLFPDTATGNPEPEPIAVSPSPTFADVFFTTAPPPSGRLTFIAAPSVRFFDGRGANRPWLCEIPDPLTQVAWQTPMLIHPKTLQERGLKQERIVQVRTKWGGVEAPVYSTESVCPGVLVMSIGQGHRGFGRYAKGKGANPFQALGPESDRLSGAPYFSVAPVSIHPTARTLKLAHTDGSRLQHGRKIALRIPLADLDRKSQETPHGLTMEDFPLTLPLAEGYDPERDFYPPHEHDTYRWGMVVDLDRCIGCGACAAACYAENNIGIVGEERILEGREMSWMRIERYEEPGRGDRLTFFPMFCQHCDNAPCESVCPVYAPHHSKEGLNNQIYNRCIGTRFCVQNCPYKVRRFNWFEWERPKPLAQQLNPDVTVRSKGVMEKCSFCIQRIKAAHDAAKNEQRTIRDGEVIPACVQTCPTGALSFGNLMDTASRVRQLADDPRAYQAMGYLNTKPAVIYLKKIVQEA